MSERSFCSEAVADERRALCGLTHLTLNGKPAKLSGALLKWPIITDLETGLSCEFAWVTVYNIIENRDGKFFSN